MSGFSRNLVTFAVGAILACGVDASAQDSFNQRQSAAALNVPGPAAYENPEADAAAIEAVLDAFADAPIELERAILDQLIIDLTTPTLAEVTAQIQSDETTLDSTGLLFSSCACTTPVMTRIDLMLESSQARMMFESRALETTLSLVSSTDEKKADDACCEKVRVKSSFELSLELELQSTSPAMAQWARLGTIYRVPELATITPKYTGDGKPKLPGNRKWEGCKKDWAGAKDDFKKKIKDEMEKKIADLKKNGMTDSVVVEVELTRKDNGRKEKVQITFLHLFKVKEGSFSWTKDETFALDCKGKEQTPPIETVEIKK